jgi:hypothetical protein
LLELTPLHTATVERLVAQGFTPAAFPLYANAIAIRRGPFAALLVPLPAGRLRILSDPSYLIEGNLSVRVRRDDRQWFVWKEKSVEATPDLLAQLTRFSEELSNLLATQ